MGSNLFLLFNHTLTADQERQASDSLGISRIVSLPGELQELWSNIPPEPSEVEPYLARVKQWLGSQAQAGDYALIQGDFGATYLLVRFALERGLVPVCSTTRREALEEPQEDGSLKVVHRFKHVRFRKYGG